MPRCEYSLFVITIGLLSLAGCGSGTTDSCEPGTSVGCSCADGSPGERYCVDGKLDECSCEEDGPCLDVTCSGHGTCTVWGETPVCACDPGYTPSSHAGLDCVPTEEVCVGGPIDYDVDNDGQNDSWFEPAADECFMFELVNLTRATHDDEGAPECHTPLMWSVEWAAHGRNHSIQQAEQGELYHDDVPFPGGQNCAYGCDPECEMDLYMIGPDEPHCPELSHHCNIMRCSFSHIGIGYHGTWNTQNFY